MKHEKPFSSDNAVLAAHISKANIGAQSVEHGFVTGSLVFENAARQVIEIIPLPEAEAKDAGIEAIKENFRKIQLPKNSYGPANAKAYLRKQTVPDFHTITLEPYDLPQAVSGHRMSAEERLKDTLVGHIIDNPGTTPQRLDELAGTKGPFKASKAKLREARATLVEERIIRERPVTLEDRKLYDLPRQAKKLYEVCDGNLPVA